MGTLDSVLRDLAQLKGASYADADAKHFQRRAARRGAFARHGRGRCSCSASTRFPFSRQLQSPLPISGLTMLCASTLPSCDLPNTGSRFSWADGARISPSRSPSSMVPLLASAWLLRSVLTACA